jgi:hypothetical protein
LTDAASSEFFAAWAAAGISIGGSIAPRCFRIFSVSLEID